MATIKDQAVVLRKLDYSETSQVLALFTRHHGKVRIIAKGVKRSTRARFAPAIDLLDIGAVVFSVRQPRQEALAILSEWTQVSAAGGLRDRLDRLYAAQYAAALTADLTEDWDPHAALFDALTELLASLVYAERTLALLVDFQRTLLVEVGLAPTVDRCVACSRLAPATAGLQFSAHEGGLICRDCEGAFSEKRGVDPESLPWLSGRAGAERGLRGAFELLDYHAAHLIGRPVPLSRAYLSIC